MMSIHLYVSNLKSTKIWLTRKFLEKPNYLSDRLEMTLKGLLLHSVYEFYLLNCRKQDRRHGLARRSPPPPLPQQSTRPQIFADRPYYRH